MLVDDDLSSISSGTTYCDTTTFSDAQSIIKKYNLIRKFPTSVFDRISNGVKEKIPETPKKPKITKLLLLQIIQIASTQWKQKAKELGYKTKIISVSGRY